MANLIVSKGRMLAGIKDFRKYVRDSEYLDLPSLSDGDQKVYLLVKIYEKSSNYIRLKASADYKVDWGDGLGSVNYSSGAFADKSIDFTNISSTTQTTAGYRQAIVTLEPQAGQNLTSFVMGNLLNPNDPYIGNNNIIDCKMASPNIASLYRSFYINYGLEQFEFVGTCNVTSMSEAFYNSYRLRKVVGIDTSNVTSFYRCFGGCQLLLEVPKLDLSSATNITYMFWNCYKIEYIQPWSLDADAPNITSISNMFNGCGILMVCPITSCTNITNFGIAFKNNKWGGEFNLDCSNAVTVANMFEGCINLISCNATFPNNLTNTSYMFDNCTNLEEIKVFDCSNVTSCRTMFRSTSRLKDLSAFNFSSATTMEYMFISSGIIKSPSQLGGGSLTYFSQGASQLKKWGNFNGTPPSSIFRGFNSNTSLEELPNIVLNTAATSFNTAFNSMTSLSKIPAWDGSNITSCGSWFEGCLSLQEVLITGLTVSHSYRYCNLERAQIVVIFNNLGTASGTQTINVFQNPGSAAVTNAELAIATAKGWTVVIT